MVDEVDRPQGGFSNSGLGAYATPTPVKPNRGWLEAAGDVALDTAAGGVGMLRGVAGARDAVATAINTGPPTGERRSMDSLADLESYLKGSRSESAQYVDKNGGPDITREPVTYGLHVASGIAPYAPLALAGPWGAIPMGAVAYGQGRADIRETIRQAKPEHLMESPRIKEMLAEGMSLDQAREKLYDETVDPTKLDNVLRSLPAVAGNMLGFGAGMAATKKLMRGATGTMVDRIIANVSGGSALKATGIGVAEGAGAGFAQGTGTEYTRQANEQAAGLRPNIDYGEVAHAGVEPAALFGALSGAGRGVSRLRQLRSERAELAPPIGTDTEFAASTEAQADQPAPGYKPAGVDGGYDYGGMGDVPPPGGGAGPSYRPPFEPRSPQPFNVPEPGAERPPGYDPAQPGGGRRPEPVREEEPPPIMTPEARPPFEFPDIERFDPREGGGYPHEESAQAPAPAAEPAPRPLYTQASPQPAAPAAGATGRTPKGKKSAGPLPAFEHIVETPEGLARGASYEEMPLRPGEEGPPAPPHFPQPPGGNQRIAARRQREETVGAKWRERQRERTERRTAVEGEQPEGAREPWMSVHLDLAKAATRTTDHPFGKPGRPEIEDFGERAEPKIDWRDRDRIEKALVTKDATTRNGWANRLQRARDAGRTPSISDLPVIGQRMLGNIREHLDRMMAEHPQGTIDAIRGRHTEPVPDQSMSPDQKNGLTSLKNSLTDAELNNLNAFTRKLLEGGLKRIVWNRLPSSTRKVLDDLPKETRSAVVEAYTKHAFEAVEFTHGKERTQPATEYRYKGDETPAARNEKLDLDEAEAAGPKAKPAAEAPVRQEQTTEEALGSILEGDWPKEQVTRNLEDVLGLKQAPASGESLMLPAYQNMRRQAITRIEAGGPWFDKLSPTEQQALLRFKGKLQKNPNANISPLPELRRYMKMADNATALSRSLNRMDRDDMRRKLSEAKRGSERTRIEAATREGLIKRTLADPELSYNTLANAYTKDPVTGEMVKTKGKGTTVRQLFEKLLDLPTYVKDGTDFAHSPDHLVLTAAERFRDLGLARIESAQRQMQEVKGSGRGQLSWQVPWRRGGKYQWYDMLADTNRLTKALDVAIARKSIPRLKALMTNFYIMEKAIEMGRIDHWDAHVKEQTGTNYHTIQKKLVGLSNRVRQFNDWEDLINTTERRFAGGRKPTLSDIEQTAYTAAKKNYDAKEHANRRAELDALQEKVDRMDTLSGLDPYTLLKGESATSNTEANLVAALDDARAIKAGHDMSLDYILKHLVEPNEEQAIQKARDEKRMNEADRAKGESRETAPAKGDEVIQKIEPHKLVDQIVKMNDRMDRYNDALEAIDAGGRDMPVRDQVKLLHEALGDDSLPKKITRENVDTLTKEMETRLKAAEDAQRKLAEDANPDMLGQEYGIKAILDSNADLSIRTNLPKGAYVRRVSDFLKTGHGQQYSIRPRDLPGRAPVALNADQRANVLQNHMFDVANKVAGDVEVVALTNEQMNLAERQRDLPADRPAFYDPKTHRIFIRQDVLNGADRGRVLGHEITHPMMEVALEMFPDIAKRIDNIRLELKKAWAEPYSKAGEIMGHRTQALENVHEFLSEFYNDGGVVQRALMHVEMPGDHKERDTRWGALQRFLKAARDGLFRLILRDTHKTALTDAIVNSLDLLKGVEAKSDRAARDGSSYLRPSGEGPARAINREQIIEKGEEFARATVSAAAHTFNRLDSGNAAGIWGHDLAQKARRAEPGMQETVEAIRTAMAKSFGSAKRIMEEAGVNRIGAHIADTMRRSSQAWDRFENYISAENHAGLSGADPIGEGRNAWVSKTADEHAQYRARHADLQKEWAKLPPPMRAIRNALADFYQKRHDDIARESVRQLIEMRKMVKPGDLGVSDALIKFIRDKSKLTDAEKTLLQSKVEGFSFDADANNKTTEYAKFRQQVREIGSIPSLRTVPGMWYPMLRRGDWVVHAEHKMDRLGKPLGGVDRKNGTWEFDTPAQRKQFMDQMHADPKLKDLKFQAMEDVVYRTDANGKVLMEDDAPVLATEPGTRTARVQGEKDVPGYKAVTTTAERKLSAEKAADTPETAVRYRVRYNPTLLEFYDKQRHAHERHAELKTGYTTDEIDLRHVSPKKEIEDTYLNAAKADRAMNALIGSLEKSEGWKEATASARAKMLKDLYEGKVRHTMAASARSTYMPRKYALGARKDVLKDFTEYSTNTSYSLAELRHRNEVTTTYKAMDDYVEKMKHAGSPGDPQGKFNVLRHELQKSLHNAADYVPDPIFGPWWQRGLSRALQYSYLDKLVSPANWALNMAELAMSSGPLLAGEHGARAYAEMKRAADAIGWNHVLEGFNDARTVLKAGVGGVPVLPDATLRMKERLKAQPDAKQLHELIDFLEMYAHFDRDSNMEIGRLVEPSTGTWQRGVDYIDNASRQIGAAIDTNSKIITAIAAYRMARAEGRGGGRSHEAAMKHAERMVHDTIGNYAKYNEAAMFRVPVLGPMLQFKRFAQRMTANWLRVAYQSAWFEDVPPAQREIARRQLAYMAGTLVLTSGVLGLPTEPLKVVINAFSPITGFNSDDAENWVRQRASDVVGPDMGEVLTRGIPRYFNVGFGTRLGIDSLWTQGAPGDKPDDWIKGAVHTFAGAPGGYLMDAASGVGRLGEAAANFARGETTEGMNNLRYGAQLVLPIKVGADVINSASNYYAGPEGRTRYGQKQGIQPTAFEAIMEAAGVRSGRTQEMGDKRRAIVREEQKYEDARNKLYAMYANAGSRAEKTAIWNGVRENFNPEWPRPMRLSLDDMVKAEARIKAKSKLPEDQVGLTMSAKQRSILPEYSAYRTQ